ncbi:hypothetical protein [Streptomyces virginiae]|uniref:C2H2-type domain-containing protein n=1 Tax=Streptomyces virginiae TaxID=1961 RepID=A0ABZ1TFI8_STRVG|nr:hypothetical protein [Streptomyces virginiae]
MTLLLHALANSLGFLLLLGTLRLCGYTVTITRRQPRPASSQVPPCQHCGRPIRNAVYYEQHDDGLHAWHTDRPACWAAALKDGQP